MRKKYFKPIVYILVFIGVITMLMPFAWMIVTSFKLDSEVESWPPQWTSENFAFSRQLNLNLVRSEDVSIDFSSLTIEEFFNLNTLLQSMRSEEKVLSYSVDDDAPYRGIMTLKLSAAGNPVSYSKKFDNNKLNELINLLSEENVENKEFYSFLQTLNGIEDPELKISSLLNQMFYKENAFVSRKNMVSFVEETSLSVLEYLEKNGSKLIGNSKLKITDEDSSEERLEKEEIKKYLESVVEKFPTKVGKLSLFLDDFIKGKPELAIEEINKFETEFVNLFSDIMATEFDSEKWSVMRVFDKYVSSPLKTVSNLLKAGDMTFRFFGDAQEINTDDFEIAFRFKPSEAIREELIRSIGESGYSVSEKTLVLDLIEKNDLEKTTNMLMGIFDEQLSENLISLGFDKDKSISVSSSIKEFTENLNSEINSAGKIENDVIAAITANDNFSEILAGNDIPKTRISVINSQYNKIMGSAESGNIDLAKINRLIVKRYEDSKFVKYYSSLYTKISSSMEIIKAPEIVKDVRYKNRRSVEIVFDSVNPIWFWDENPELKVDYSVSEWLANLFQNYVNAWETGKYFGNYYFNTVLVATVTTVLDILFAAMAAFAFSKLNFFGKNFLFSLFLATMMVPGEVLLVPNYITLSKFGWIDTYYALIVPWTVSVFVIFLMRQHFMSIPNELYDAGRIDGISKWGFLWKIIIPLSKPVIITGALLKFVGSWNSFLWVLIVTKSPEVRTLPVGLSNFNSDVGTLYNQLMAASTFSMLPIVILFLFVQKYFIQGISRTGLK